jgi:hypothetical protein
MILFQRHFDLHLHLLLGRQLLEQQLVRRLLEQQVLRLRCMLQMGFDWGH